MKRLYQNNEKLINGTTTICFKIILIARHKIVLETKIKVRLDK